MSCIFTQDELFKKNMEKDIFQEEGVGQEEGIEETKIDEWDDTEEDNLDFITEYKDDSEDAETR